MHPFSEHHRNCTICMPEKTLDALDTLVNLGYFPTRCEAIRHALRQFLEDEMGFIDDLEPERFTALKEDQLKALMGVWKR